jgi:hypothetical protein
MTLSASSSNAPLFHGSAVFFLLAMVRVAKLD